LKRLRTLSKCTVICSFFLVVLLAASCAPAAPPTAMPTTVSLPSPTVAPTTVSLPSPTVAPTTPPALPTPTLASAGIPASIEKIQRISPEELKALIEGGADIVVVDNQPKGAYDLGHIKGAVNFPWAMEIKGPGDLPKDKLLITYCGCAHEEDASDVAMQLITKFGFRKVMLLDGGWFKCVELGYPTEKSK